jgi:putative oxidoreductase
MLFLRPLRRGSDVALLIVRVLLGVFLILGVWDNITSTERMAEFVAFLTKFGCPWPELAAPVSVWAQFFGGVAILLGVFTRWAGLLMAFNFVVAWLLVGRLQSFREMFPILVLIAVPLFLATYGAGRLALDPWLERRTGGRRRRVG